MPAPVTRKMSDRHEEHLAEVLGGTRTKNSGATWSDTGDGHQTHTGEHWRFSWDGKSTLGKSIGLTVETWRKTAEQARGLLPMMPLRWYRDNRLNIVDLDLVAIELDTFVEMQADANAYRRMTDIGCAGGIHDHRRDDGPSNGPCRGCGLAPYEAGQFLTDD